MIQQTVNSKNANKTTETDAKTQIFRRIQITSSYSGRFALDFDRIS